MVGTVIENSSTSLLTWLFTAYLIISKPTITIKEIQAATGVSHKTAWRMRRLIRCALESVRDASTDMASVGAADKASEGF